MKRDRHSIVLLLAFIVCFCWPPEGVSAENKAMGEIAKQSYQSIPKDEFRRIFEEYICVRLGKDKSDVIVSRLKVAGDKPVPAGKITFQVFQKDKRRLVKNVRLVAAIRVDGVVKNKVTFSGWVDVFEPVVCISHNLKRGAIIMADDIYLARKNIAHLSPDVLTDAAKAVGLMVKHNVKRDSCLGEWMLERSPLVSKGDRVTILAESGDLRVTVPGKILEKGYWGEVIRVQNLMSEKKIYAKVMSSSAVRVDF